MKSSGPRIRPFIHRYRRCSRKKPYADYQAAAARRDELAAAGVQVAVYQCGWCWAWHLGHEETHGRK